VVLVVMAALAAAAAVLVEINLQTTQKEAVAQVVLVDQHQQDLLDQVIVEPLLALVEQLEMPQAKQEAVVAVLAVHV
jgi:hypothetical protein